MKQNYITTLISIDHLFFLKKNQVFTKEQGYFWGQTRVTYYWVASIITYCYTSYVIDIASDNKDNNWWYVTSYCDKTGKSDKSVNTSSSIYELSANVLTGNIKFWKQHQIWKTSWSQSETLSCPLRVWWQSLVPYSYFCHWQLISPLVS